MIIDLPDHMILQIEMFIERGAKHEKTTLGQQATIGQILHALHTPLTKPKSLMPSKEVKSNENKNAKNF